MNTNLPQEAANAVRGCVIREMKATTRYELPLLDAYIALASSTLVTSSQLQTTEIRATPKEIFPVAVDEVNRQRAKKLAEYFPDDNPEDRFYLLCIAKGYQDAIPLDPPWIDEVAVMAMAAGVENPAKAGLVEKQKGKHRLVRNPDLDARWATEQPQLPRTDFTPNRLEGNPVFETPEREPPPFQKLLL